MSVEGALEAVGLSETMIWRPAAPLIAGATYVVQVAVDNAAIASNLEEECGPDLLEMRTKTPSVGTACGLPATSSSQRPTSSQMSGEQA